MADSRIFGPTSQMIGKALDISARRHKLIAGNIANMDTIGFKPKDLDFNRALKRAISEKEPDYLNKTHSKHVSSENGEVVSMNGENSEEVDIHHLDSVNIDREMMSLAENNIKYRTIVELKLRKSKITSYAIEQGGK